jgi:hypothetical protein
VTHDEAKRLIRTRWMHLPLADRQTEDQAAAFAFFQMSSVPFRTNADAYQVIKGWLTHDLHTTRNIG